MTLQEISAVLGIVVISSGAVGGAGKYYLDTEYVAQGQLQEFFQQRDLKEFKRDLRKLKRIPEGERTEREQWEIEDLEDEIEDLQDDLSTDSTG